MVVNPYVMDSQWIVYARLCEARIRPAEQYLWPLAVSRNRCSLIRRTQKNQRKYVSHPHRPPPPPHFFFFFTFWDHNVSFFVPLHTVFARYKLPCLSLCLQHGLRVASVAFMVRCYVGLKSRFNIVITFRDMYFCLFVCLFFFVLTELRAKVE